MAIAPEIRQLRKRQKMQSEAVGSDMRRRSLCKILPSAQPPAGFTNAVPRPCFPGGSPRRT